MFHNQSSSSKSFHANTYPLRESVSTRLFFESLIRTKVLLVFLASVAMSGCQTLSLPAIDPTGNRIFSNEFTKIVNPHDPSNGYPSQQPAFQAPPNPPACMQGKDGSPKKLCQGCLSGKGCLAKRKAAEEIRGRCGQLLLTPLSIVAPVGGEVILLAGICGKDEFLVTNEPIEWMLSPTSVGEFVEVGDDAKGQRRSFWKRDDSPRVEKLGVDFARGRTSREAGNITRGTANPADDLPIRTGQTWISITSPNEGISKVTALAPDSDVWDQRRQTATIYWEDAEWDFPLPKFASSGEVVTLVTHVWRSDKSIGAEGWEVRYRVLNKELANFRGNEGYSPEIEVKADKNGVAKVDIEIGKQPGMPIPPRGTAAVEIQVVRPKRPSENIPELILAVGTTTVTWTAPQLQLNVSGPESAVPGQILNYYAKVANIGDVDAENVTISLKLPPGMVLQPNSTPPTQQTPDSLTWGPSRIPLKQMADISINMLANAQIDANIQFDVSYVFQGSEILQSQSQRTHVQQPQVTLRVVPRPETTQVEVGGNAVFDVIVTNTGRETINDLKIVLQSEPGLQYVKDNLNSAVYVIGILRPNDRPPEMTAVFRVEHEGDLSVRATAQALGQTLASSQPAVIRGLPSRPKTPSLGLQIASPDLRNPAVIPVGGQFKAEWKVTNTGPVVLRNPIISMQHSSNLEVKGLSPGGSYEAVRQFAQWRSQDLQPGASIGLEGLFQGVSAGNPASVVVSVDSETLSDRQSLILDVSNASSGTNVMPPGDGPLGSRGELQKPALTLDDQIEKRLSVTIQPVSNSIRKGDVGTYEIRIENLSSKPDQRVALSLLTPAGAVLKSIRAKDLRYKLSNSDRQIDLEPIKYFRPNDFFSCVVQLKHDEITFGELIASVTSLGQTTPVSKSLSIQVLER